MSVEESWASVEDFATLFQYFWHRDFPMDAKKAIGAGRADWTIHIGIVVRNIADLMGLVTRFERGGRKDAILRSTEGDEIAIEWEWDGVWGNELEKLKHHKVWSIRKLCLHESNHQDRRYFFNAHNITSEESIIWIQKQQK